MSGAVVQSASSGPSDNASAILTFGAAPTNGNRLVAMCAHFTNGATAGTGWTLDTNLNAGLDYGIAIAIKVAGAGESASQQPFASGGSGYVVCWEISGLTGTWATDKQQVGDGVDLTLTSGTHYSTTTFNTSANDTGILGLMGADAATVGNGGPTQTTSGFSYTGGVSPQTDRLGVQTTGINRNATFVGFHDYFPTSGTAVQYTPTFPVTESKGQYVLLAINGWAAPVSAFVPRTILY